MSFEEYFDYQESLLKHGYEYQKVLGQGGFSTVHLVKSLKYQQCFASKIVHYGSSERSAQKKIQEISIMITLNHPNILSIYDYFQEKGNLYIILEYCPGGSLSELINERGPIRPPKLFIYWNQILNSLNLCFDSHIAHRDIKPQNILIDSYGRLKLSDFGLSKEINCGETIVDHSGTRFYRAPELVSGSIYDPFKADIWSLGILFYQMAYGRLPWSKKITNLSKDIEGTIGLGCLGYPPLGYPEGKLVIGIIERMVHKNPNSRITIKELLSIPALQVQVPPENPAFSKHLKKRPNFHNIKSLTCLAKRNGWNSPPAVPPPRNVLNQNMAGITRSFPNLHNTGQLYDPFPYRKRAITDFS